MIGSLLREPIAQYPLITGEGNTAKDIVGHYDGSIRNVYGNSIHNLANNKRTLLPSKKVDS
ncbi:MAG: hypothetical protein K8R74_06230 [Bacteroidales bacterium]|nr:hypothetical protein [Bacteroidales bacterium]